MKQKFSTHWKSSSQPRKQRKYKANAPLHIKKKFVSVNLSKELRKKLEKRNISAKKGDKIKVCRGKFKGKTGKIIKVDIKTSKITVEEIQVKKQDGSKANVKLQPSNLQIIEIADRKTKKKPEEKKQEKETTKKDTKNKEKQENKK